MKSMYLLCWKFLKEFSRPSEREWGWLGCNGRDLHVMANAIPQTTATILRRILTWLEGFYNEFFRPWSTTDTLWSYIFIDIDYGQYIWCKNKADRWIRNGKGKEELPACRLERHQLQRGAERRVGKGSKPSRFSLILLLQPMPSTADAATDHGTLADLVWECGGLSRETFFHLLLTSLHQTWPLAFLLLLRRIRWCTWHLFWMVLEKSRREVV